MTSVVIYVCDSCLAGDMSQYLLMSRFKHWFHLILGARQTYGFENGFRSTKTVLLRTHYRQFLQILI